MLQTCLKFMKRVPQNRLINQMMKITGIANVIVFIAKIS